MIRQPVVAGQFYANEAQQLRQEVNRHLPETEQQQQVLAAIAPHAGYMFSGSIAGTVLGRIEIPETVILLGPNHRGLGAAVALSAAQAWQTPLGRVDVDDALRQKLLQTLPQAREDERGHQLEHSLEVMLPFLQCRNPQCRIVPISLAGVSLQNCRELGQALANVVSAEKEKSILLLASTDMTHFTSAQQAEAQDKEAIAQIEALNPEGLYTLVAQKGITMCGVIPTTIVLQAALDLGAQQAQLLAYGNSGDVTGDYSQVVAYAGMVVS